MILTKAEQEKRLRIMRVLSGNPEVQISYGCLSTLADAAVRNASTDDEARDSIEVLLEAIGYTDIPDDVPLECGHYTRDQPREVYVWGAPCKQCKNEKQLAKKRGEKVGDQG